MVMRAFQYVLNLEGDGTLFRMCAICFDNSSLAYLKSLILFIFLKVFKL